ncbi:uncharacterized protein LOC131875246 [Cryptomeria japonica]|uniref:uncharacterized protein LOC131875246 n=1 Tax=Cryptomeria japonica TaxID=3369 RepID=UPI0027D9DABA|nr:uncharacterized protein LOC131875246 [Cryptomeria japonica]
MAKLLKAVKSGDSKTRTNLPMYEGKMDDEILLDWFSALENYFDCEDVEDKYKVKIAMSRMKGHALLWWDNLQADRGKKGLPKITSWPRMMDKMKDKFLPDDYKVQLYKKMQGPKQKDMDVQKYTKEFHKLDIRAAHDKDVEEKVARYLGGFRYNIQNEMTMATPKTLEECYKLAMKAEDKLKRRQERQGGRRGQTNRGRGGRFQESQEPNDKGKEPDADQKNGQRGGGRFGARRSFQGKCYKCGEEGHPFYKCPEKENYVKKTDKRVNLTQGEDYKQQDEEEGTSKAYPEVGECLMMGKAPMQQQEKPKVSIFRTNCKSHGKVCRMIIDSGSFDNLMSYEMVNKLKLQKFPLDRPYRASWVSNEQNIVIREQTYVDFSIGGYSDRVLCDVVPMTCCHIILGRPWQVSHRTIHYGFENVYKVHKDGKSFTLQPLPNDVNAGERIIVFGTKTYVDLQGQKMHESEVSDLKKKSSLLVVKTEVLDSKCKRTVGQQTMMKDGVMVGTLWCPIVSPLRNDQGMSMKDSNRGHSDPNMQMERQFMQAKVDCS